MKTLEGNKLIAEFMCLGIQLNMVESPITREYIDIDELKYHNSWNWLMPVIRKIVEYCTNENEDAFMSDEYTSILDTIPLAIITDAWKVVVEFIEYYNDLNKN